jgi:hypothetical protein
VAVRMIAATRKVLFLKIHLHPALPRSVPRA